MLSRALSLATVILLTGFATVPAQAQNLEAGKSSSQVFAGGCAVCHKSPRGLLKTVAPGALPGFLRQHYTTSTDMAAAMSAYVISNGAADRRQGGDSLTKQGRELSTEQRPAAAKPDGAPAEAAPTGRRQRQQAVRPDVDGQPGQVESGARPGRNAKRQARPAVENPEGTKPEAAEAVPAQKQKLGKKGRRHQEEPPKAEPVKDEPKVEPKVEPKAEPKPESAKSEPAKPETPKDEASKPAAVKPAEELKAEPKPEAKPESPLLRADPVPAVTPAPKPPASTEAAPAPSTPATSAEPAAAPAAPVPAPPAAPSPAASTSAPAAPPPAPAAAAPSAPGPALPPPPAAAPSTPSAPAAPPASQ